MFCPRCGQQQVSDEMRFCSRCGLPIGGLIEWLGRAGFPPAPVQDTQNSLSSVPSPRKKGIRRGGKVMFASAVLFVIFLIISLAADDPGPLAVPFFVFFAGLVMMLYARLFSSPVPQIKAQYTPPSVGPMSNALPPHTHVPMHDIPHQRGRTNELAQPSSVTEHTTKLLDNQ